MTHTNITHLGRRDHICPREGCGQTYGYKHLLKRHLAKAHATAASVDDDETADDYETDDFGHTNGGKTTGKTKAGTSLDIDTITGHSYAKRADASVANATALLCPYPKLDQIQFAMLDDPVVNSAQQPNTMRNCEYAFSRAYDLRRHLRAVHSLDAGKDSLDQWVKDKKLEERAKFTTTVAKEPIVPASV